MTLRSARVRESQGHTFTALSFAPETNSFGQRNYSNVMAYSLPVDQQPVPHSPLLP
jgi:hypothetical protein